MTKEGCSIPCHFLSSFFSLGLQQLSGSLPKSVFLKQKAFLSPPTPCFLKFGNWPWGAQRGAYWPRDTETPFAVPWFPEHHPMKKLAEQSQLLPFFGCPILGLCCQNHSCLERSTFTSSTIHSVNQYSYQFLLSSFCVPGQELGMQW